MLYHPALFAVVSRCVALRCVALRCVALCYAILRCDMQGHVMPCHPMRITLCVLLVTAPYHHILPYVRTSTYACMCVCLYDSVDARCHAM